MTSTKKAPWEEMLMVLAGRMILNLIITNDTSRDLVSEALIDANFASSRLDLAALGTAVLDMIKDDPAMRTYFMASFSKAASKTGCKLDGPSNSATTNPSTKKPDMHMSTQRFKRVVMEAARSDFSIENALGLGNTAALHREASAELQRCREQVAELEAERCSFLTKLDVIRKRWAAMNLDLLSE